MIGAGGEPFPSHPTRIANAETLVLGLSQTANQRLDVTDKKARSERRLEENREALDSFNAWVEANGLPLEKYRLF